jgi:hypothetical protein
MPKRANPNPNKGPGSATPLPVAAGVAGAGGSTVLLVLINNIFHPTDDWKPVILYVSPYVSILVGALWILVNNSIQRWTANRDANAEAVRYEKTVRDILDDPSMSEDVKQKAREQFASTKLRILEIHSQRIESRYESIITRGEQ